MITPKLNLPDPGLKIKLVESTMQVFDQVRKKYLNLTSEEWVRQHFISYLNRVKKYPISLMKVEHVIRYNNMRNRADLVLYNIDGLPTMIVECKAPSVKVTQDTFYQLAKYNFRLKVDFLVVTNGLEHFCCKMDYVNKSIKFLKDIPSY